MGKRKVTEHFSAAFDTGDYDIGYSFTISKSGLAFLNLFSAGLHLISTLEPNKSISQFTLTPVVLNPGVSMNND